MRRFLALPLALLAAPALAQTPELVVYTYDSFDTEWGPGPIVEAAFEAECGCDLRFVAAGDGAALLSRLQLEGPSTEADVILGLDTALTAAAADTGLFAPHGLSPEMDLLPVAWDDPLFVPFDWGYFAFVADAGTEAPATFRELADSDLSIVIEDPRSSTPGLGLLLWVEAAYGDEAGAIWEGLADNIVTVTPGWTEAYNLFLEGEADAVLSYTTSPSYHVIAEEDDGKVAWTFDEGHYMQIEVAGIVAGTDQPDLARDFLAFMTTDAAQSAIPTTNWMFPVATPSDGLPEGFAEPLPADAALLLPPQEAQAVRDPALETWRTALSR
ncbi:thiamine ABC transporter substrate binding subunit [Wenxinia marina]|uniref:Thiamine-binding periplasmic protein n=1 Tax=Wenxinia marina DSM 24838 TaxID=1123501 RepID=A0A0D0Q7D2_9RHOB|nr:thiamine ABC transporter substrate binding subunit [Wenxinia marina]KIQ70344.1 thiamine ABC transporter, periplasmic binding protein [Wenxinia marina DSM 24838]GGL53873.1 thiamine transporter substrate binding subunit [Wenxinia marina]